MSGRKQLAWAVLRESAVCDRKITPPEGCQQDAQRHRLIFLSFFQVHPMHPRQPGAPGLPLFSPQGHFICKCAVGPKGCH